MIIAFSQMGIEALQMLTLCFQVAVIIAQIMNLLGSVFCLSIPPESGARGWIFASVGAEVLSMVITVAALLKVNPENAQNAQQLLGIIAFVTLILFLRKLGLFIRRADLAQQAVGLLTFGEC